jgi:hypothetical protein
MNNVGRLVIVILIGSSAIGCASLSEERAQVRSIAALRVTSKDLPCTQSDLTVDLDTDDGTTRQWVAGCNFKAILVACSRGSCKQVIERTWREELYGEAR